MCKPFNYINMKQFISYCLLIISAVLFFTGCNCDSNYSSVDDMVIKISDNVEQILVDDLKKKLDEGEMFLLIDVREQSEHNHGYIPGAVHICRGTLEFKIGNEDFWENQFLYLPEKHEEIIVYCKKGRRGVLATNSLEQLGYSNVKNLSGGWKEWETTFPLIYEKNLEQVSHDDTEEEGGC